MISARRWVLNPDCRLYRRHWEQDYLLFNAASGQTHLLNEIGIQTLDWLAETPLSAGELVSSLVAEFDLQEDDQLHDYISQTLTAFDELGLVVPVP